MDHPRRQNVTASKRSHTQKISPKMVNPRDKAGNGEEEEEEEEEGEDEEFRKSLDGWRTVHDFKNT